MEEITRRLNFLRGNTTELSPNNTPELNSSIIARQNKQKFQNRQIRERVKEIKNIPKGIIKKRKPSLNFNFPERYLRPSPIQNQDDNDFLSYLQPSQHILEPQEPRETSFLFSDGAKRESLSPLRNWLTNIAPLPSKPTIDNFARPITQMINEKNNPIAITPKRPVPKIEATNLSEGLQSVFSDVDQTIKEESETYKERIKDLDEIIEKVSKISDDEDGQKLFEFEFFTGGFNQKFDSFAHSKGLSTENQEFIDFLQWDMCKQILEDSHLKIHIETGNIYYKNEDTNESIFRFIENQQDSSKGLINYHLSFEGNYNDYYRWILNNFDSYEKTKLDLLTQKNTKYLVYRFNDTLKSTGQPLIKIRHSKVTDDYLQLKKFKIKIGKILLSELLNFVNQKKLVKL